MSEKPYTTMVPSPACCDPCGITFDAPTTGKVFPLCTYCGKPLTPGRCVTHQALRSELASLRTQVEELGDLLSDVTVLLKRGGNEMYIIANSESFSVDCRETLKALAALRDPGHA